MRQRRREATANYSNSPKLHYREGFLPIVQIKPVIFSLFRCTFDELLFSCCESVLASRGAAWAPLSAPCDAQRAAPRAMAWADTGDY